MQISIKSSGRFASALREKGFRATYGRVALLEALAEAGKPLAVETLAQKISGKLDVVNVYRALEALSEAGLVARVGLGHQHTHYEFSSALASHHHHFVCEGCGVRAPHP
jgi:Fe2+ or Zn2+ uptake regulation protein